MYIVYCILKILMAKLQKLQIFKKKNTKILQNFCREIKMLFFPRFQLFLNYVKL